MVEIEICSWHANCSTDAEPWISIRRREMCSSLLEKNTNIIHYFCGMEGFSIQCSHGTERETLLTSYGILITHMGKIKYYWSYHRMDRNNFDYPYDVRYVILIELGDLAKLIPCSLIVNKERATSGWVLVRNGMMFAGYLDRLDHVLTILPE